MFDLPFGRLGIFNWYSNNTLDFRYRKFHKIDPYKREAYLDQAVQRFEDAYNSSKPHARYGNVQFRLKKGRTMAKLMKKEENDRESIYAFIDINMKDPERYGGMMKPATWKAPEPKRYVRAHLFAKNPLRGATWYGPDYMDGGKKGDAAKHLRDNWFRDSFKDENKEAK